MSELIQPIDNKSPLAKFFNKIISKIQILRIISLPRTFEDVKGNEASFKMMTYYQTVLWEKWMHGVVKRLEEWDAVIDEYFDEFDGSWEYYALSKRLESINKCESDDEDNFNPDGSIKTKGIMKEQLYYFTIFLHLYQDCVDIVQDSRPSDLKLLIEAVGVKSRFSVIDVLSKVEGKKIPSYIIDKDGTLRQTTFAEREMRKALEKVEAHDDGQLIYLIASIMEQLTTELETIAKSDAIYSDQNDLLYTIQNDIDALLNLQFEETRFIKTQKGLRG